MRKNESNSLTYRFAAFRRKLFSGNYKNTTTFYDEAFFGEYQNDRDRTVSEFQRAFNQEGITGANNVLLGGLAGVAFKTLNSKYKLNVMRLQNGESSAGQFNLLDDDNAIGKSGYRMSPMNQPCFMPMRKLKLNIIYQYLIYFLIKITII